MSLIKHQFQFWVSLVVVALLAESWLLQRERSQARQAVAALEQKRQERDRLATQSPALSEGNEQAIRSELNDSGKTLATWRAALRGRDAQVLDMPPPERSIDAYFDIAAFVERTRAQATHAQVKLKPDERFGFSTYASEGPGTELIPAVFRQRIALQCLVETLIEARPLAVLAVQRERPLTLAQRARRSHLPAVADYGTGPDGHSGQPGDFFDFEKGSSLRMPGLVDGEAFRVEFTGQTRAVRAFLNSLAAFRLPLVVRGVEAGPLGAASRAGETVLPPAAGAPVPLVEQNISRFAVVVEFIEPVAATGKPAP
jgi:hypothetical protein